MFVFYVQTRSVLYGLAREPRINGEGEASLKASAHDLGLRDRVVRHGFAQGATAIFRRCDVFVLSDQV